MLKKFFLFSFIFIVGCTTTQSRISYRQSVKNYNSDYQIFRIMPDHQYVMAFNKKRNLVVLIIDRKSRNVLREIALDDLLNNLK
jgi:predicted CoA-binding protein